MEIKKAVRPKQKKIIPEKKEEEAKREIDKLSPAHKAFVKEYVKNLGNGTRAYMATYPNAKYDTARAKAAELVAKDNVKRAIKEEYELYFKNKDSEIEKSKTYQMIHSLGSTPISDIVNMADRTLVVKSMDEIPPESIHAIKSLDYVERETANGIDRMIKVTLYDKLAALKLRAQMQGLLEAEGNSTVEIIVNAAQRPEDE
jgi:hypothetical protein